MKCPDCGEQVYLTIMKTESFRVLTAPSEDGYFKVTPESSMDYQTFKCQCGRMNNTPIPENYFAAIEHPQ